MDIVNVRSNIRSTLGLAAVSLAVAAVIASGPPSPQAERGWQPSADHVISDTVSLPDDRTLRLWTGPSGWYVESLKAGRHEAAVGANSGGAEYTVSEVLGGLVGYLPAAGTHSVSVGSHGAVVREDVHAGMFLVPASLVPTTDDAVLVTPLDADGRPLAAETAVPIAGRD